MKSMVLGLAAGMCVVGAALPVCAQTGAQEAVPVVAAAAVNPEAKALAGRYLTAIQFEGLMLGAMEPMLDAMAAQQPDLSEDERLLVRGVVLDSMKAVMPIYLDEVTSLYGQSMSIEELEALVAFYEAPIGRSVTAKSLTLTSQSQEMFVRFQPALNAEIMKRMEAVAAAAE